MGLGEESWSMLTDLLKNTSTPMVHVVMKDSATILSSKELYITIVIKMPVFVFFFFFSNLYLYKTVLQIFA